VPVVLRGRPAEMAAALAVLRRARAGRGGVILVTGEPGVGKSTLLAAIAGEARAMGFRVGSAGAGPGGSPLLLSLRSGPSPLLTAADVAGLADGPPVLLLDRIAAGLATLGPVLIVLDDLQSADRPTMSLLRDLCARLTGKPVVWALGSRRRSAAFLAGLEAPGPHGVRVEHIQPGLLTTADVTALASDRLGRPPGAAVQRMLDGTGGNPRLAVELIEGVRRAASRGETPQHIPSRLVRIVRRATLALDDGLRELVEVAAVLDRPMPPAGAYALLPGCPPAEVARWVDHGIAAGLLAESGHAVRFRFELVRDAVYGDLPGRRRAALHLRCARYLLAEHDAPAAVRHVLAGTTQGGDRGTAGLGTAGLGTNRRQAVPLLRQAAEQLLAGSPAATGEVAARLTEAFGRLGPNEPGWAELGARCAEVLLQAERYTDAAVTASVVAARVDEAGAIARLRSLAARALAAAGRPADALDQLNAAAGGPGLATVDQAGLRAARALARAGLGPAAQARDEAAAVLAVRPETASGGFLAAAAGMAATDGSETAVMVATGALFEVSRNLGYHGAALGYARTLRRASGARCLAAEITALELAGRLGDAELLRAEAGTGPRTAPSLVAAGMWLDLAQGRLAAAAEGAGRLDRLGLDSLLLGDQSAVVATEVALLRNESPPVRLTRPAGEDDAAARLSGLAVAGAWLALEQGDPGRAARIARPALRAAREQGAPWPWRPGWLRPLARIGLAAGDAGLVREVAETAELTAARNPGLAGFGGLAAQLRGLAWGDLTLLARAWEQLQDSPRPMLRAAAAEDYGTALLAAGQRAAGIARLDEAWHAYGEALAARRTVADTLRRAGVRRATWAPRPVPSSGWKSLTAAERKVAELVSAGYTNRAAASELGLSPNTIGTHVRSIFSKLQVQSRVQLANVRHEQAMA
jgi:DNA-binding NarL/FixJ family response regulator